MKRPYLAVAIGVLAAITTACDGNTSSDVGNGGSTPLDGVCAPEVTDCVDTSDGLSPDGARERAHGLLGRSQADLPGDVRISRIGDEHFALTDDFQVGRLTAALDDTDGSGLRVVEVLVELSSGTETFALTPG